MEQEHDDEGCQLCGGELNWLGQLGRLIWLRCRNCAMQFSREA